MISRSAFDAFTIYPPTWVDPATTVPYCVETPNHSLHLFINSNLFFQLTFVAFFSSFLFVHTHAPTHRHYTQWRWEKASLGLYKTWANRFICHTTGTGGAYQRGSSKDRPKHPFEKEGHWASSDPQGQKCSVAVWYADQRVSTIHWLLYRGITQTSNQREPCLLHFVAVISSAAEQRIVQQHRRRDQIRNNQHDHKYNDAW